MTGEEIKAAIDRVDGARQKELKELVAHLVVERDQARKERDDNHEAAMEFSRAFVEKLSVIKGLKEQRDGARRALDFVRKVFESTLSGEERGEEVEAALEAAGEEFRRRTLEGGMK